MLSVLAGMMAMLLLLAPARLLASPVWTAQTSGTTASLWDVFFSDAGTGWAVGADHIPGTYTSTGAILHTVDGGTTWIPQSPGTADFLKSVFFTDSDTGWAVGGVDLDDNGGAEGVILHTTDGGTTWVPQAFPDGSLEAVTFVDANTGWAVGWSSTILHTTNGGTTWTPQDPGTDRILEGVSFTDANTGWAVGYGLGESGSYPVILHTVNGGTTWTEQTPAPQTHSLSDVYFTDADTGWAVGSGFDAGPVDEILRTVDGGTTWTSQSTGSMADLRGCFFKDASTGWAVGYISPILQTSDGGTTWTPQTPGNTPLLEDVFFTDASAGWAVGEGGTILHYGEPPVIPITWMVKSPLPTIPGWNRTDVACTLNVTPLIGEGTAETFIQLGEIAPFVAYNSPVTFSAEGITKVSFYSVGELGGREETQTINVKIDKTAPSLSSNAVASYISNAAITLSTSDGLSGVDYVEYNLDGTGWVAGTAVNTAVPGPHVLDARAGDSAGNVANLTTVNFAVTAAPPVNVWRFRNTNAVGNYLWTADPGECETIKATLSGTWAYEGPAYNFNSANPANKDTMWRFKNKYMWSYFYSADPAEVAAIRADPNSIWQYEGPTSVKVARTTTTPTPVWRFRCLKNPTYLWTADPSEMATIRDTLQAEYKLEGIAYWLGK